MTNLQPGVLEEPPATELFLLPVEVGTELKRSHGDPARSSLVG